MVDVPDMADPCAELGPAIVTLLRADAGVAAAFAAASAPVSVHDTPATNKALNCILLGALQPLPVQGSDAAETEVTLVVRFLSDPPRKTECMAIATAALACCLGLDDLPNHTIKATRARAPLHLTDPGDALTAQSVVKFVVVTQPK